MMTFRTLIIFCIICLLLSCQNEIKTINKTIINPEAEKYLAAKRSDNSVYWGDGIADISRDIGKGKIEARLRAMNALAEQIKTKVSSDFKMIISQDSVTDTKGYSADVKKRITQKLETYTNQVLTNLKESKLFIDYPKEGSATYVVYISRKEYEDKVRNDLNRKKQLITDTIKSGDKEFTTGNYVAGINLYVQAKKLKKSFFGGIPIYHDIDGDGEVEELTICINARIRNFYTNTRLSLLNDSFQYDSEGHLETLPRVYAQYIDFEGVKHPVAGIALKPSFVKGGGRIAKIITGDYGEVEVPVSRINPKSRKVVLRLTVDISKIKDVEEIAAGCSHSILIKMKRKKTIALAVSFKNDRKNFFPRNVKEKITSLLLDKKFSVLQKSFIRESDIKSSRNVNADYIFFVEAKTFGEGAVGQYKNMYTSNCGAAIKVYSLPLKNQSFSASIKKAQGFGVSIESAGWDAFGKISDQIVTKAEEVIEGIK